MLVDEGHLDRRGVAAKNGERSRVSLPPTIQALLSARLDRLGPEERSILERGSVEGEVFHRGAVLLLSPESDRTHLDERLRILAQQELIRAGPADFADERAFRFHHQLLRDVTYESLPKATRAELHERYAGWLEDKTGDRAEEFDEILGYHLQQAYEYRVVLGPLDEHGRQLAMRAGERLGHAGLRAHARGDMWGAGKLLSGAVALLPTDAASRLQPTLDEALFETGERTRRGMSRASVRCYWRRPLGHPWEIRERAGKTWLRCTSCGKGKRYRGSMGRLDREAGFELESGGMGYRTDSRDVGGGDG